MRARSDGGTPRLRAVDEGRIGKVMLMLVDVGMSMWHVGAEVSKSHGECMFVCLFVLFVL